MTVCYWDLLWLCLFVVVGLRFAGYVFLFGWLAASSVCVSVIVFRMHCEIKMWIECVWFYAAFLFVLEYILYRVVLRFRIYSRCFLAFICNCCCKIAKETSLPRGKNAKTIKFKTLSSRARARSLPNSVRPRNFPFRVIETNTTRLSLSTTFHHRPNHRNRCFTRPASPPAARAG